MFVYIYIYMYREKDLCIFLYTYIFMYIYTYIYIYIYMRGPERGSQKGVFEKWSHFDFCSRYINDRGRLLRGHWRDPSHVHSKGLSTWVAQASFAIQHGALDKTHLHRLIYFNIEPYVHECTLTLHECMQIRFAHARPRAYLDKDARESSTAIFQTYEQNARHWMRKCSYSARTNI